MSAFRLTSQQNKFADLIIAGVNQTDAYKQAYKTDNMAPGTINSEASRLKKHPQIAAKIEAGRNRAFDGAVKATEFTHTKAIEMALAAAARADELGQSGSIVSAIRLASDLQGYIVERKREIDPAEDPINKLMSTVAGHSRVSPAATRH